LEQTSAVEDATFVPGSDPKLAALIERLKAKLSTSVDNQGMPSGAAVAVVHGGKLISAEGLGTRSKDDVPDSKMPVDRNTLFWIASTSKLMTAAAAMTMADDGILDLMAPVTDYLPDYTEQLGRQHRISVDNLLKMISGLNDDGTCVIFSQSLSQQPDGCAALTVPVPANVLKNMFSAANIAKEPYLQFNRTDKGEPGKAVWAYSNWGIMLAGRVMEVAAGKSFAELMQQRVFAPAGMPTARYDAAEVLAHGNYAIGSGSAAVDGHCPEPELGHDSHAPWFPDELACPGRNPNGGVRASAIDLGRFAEALLSDLRGAGRLMSDGAAAQLFQPTTGRAHVNPPQDRWGGTYGYCNFHHRYGGYDIYTHGGGRPGFGTLFWLIPDRDFAIAVTHNLGNTNHFEAEMQFAVGCYLDDQCK